MNTYVQDATLDRRLYLRGCLTPKECRCGPNHPGIADCQNPHGNPLLLEVERQMHGRFRKNAPARLLTALHEAAHAVVAYRLTGFLPRLYVDRFGVTGLAAAIGRRIVGLKS